MKYFDMSVVMEPLLTETRKTPLLFQAVVKVTGKSVLCKAVIDGAISAISDALDNINDGGAKQ